MKVLILYTLPPQSAGPARTVDEFDLSEAAQGIVEVCPNALAAGIAGRVHEVFAALEANAPDVVFNLCEAPLGNPALEAPIAGLLEWLGMPFTGSRSEALALCRRKDWTGAVLDAAGVPVPRAGRFPAIVKPVDEDGSAGIDEQSICENVSDVERARQRWPGGRVIVQEYLPGREFVISLWGRSTPDHISIGEFIFDRGMRINTYRSKWDMDSADFMHAQLYYNTPIDAQLRDTLAAIARAAFAAAGLRGYARLDLRLDGDGVPRVMDVNPNPELSPGVGVNRASREAGWTWAQFVEKQIEWAF